MQGRDQPFGAAQIAPLDPGYSHRDKTVGRPGENAIRKADRWERGIHALDRGFFGARSRSEEHTSELQSLAYLVCRLLLEKKKRKIGNLRVQALRISIRH